MILLTLTSIYLRFAVVTVVPWKRSPRQSPKTKWRGFGRMPNIFFDRMRSILHRVSYGTRFLIADIE